MSAAQQPISRVPDARHGMLRGYEMGCGCIREGRDHGHGGHPVTPSPQPFLDHLAATVEQFGAARFMLRQVIALADEAPTLTDRQLRTRLLRLSTLTAGLQQASNQGKRASGCAR